MARGGKYGCEGQGGGKARSESANFNRGDTNTQSDQ